MKTDRNVSNEVLSEGISTCQIVVIHYYSAMVFFIFEEMIHRGIGFFSNKVHSGYMFMSNSIKMNL